MRNLILLLFIPILASCGGKSSDPPAPRRAANATTGTNTTNSNAGTHYAYFSKESLSFKKTAVTFDLVAEISSRPIGGKSNAIIASANVNDMMKFACDGSKFTVFMLKPITKDVYDDKDNFTDGYFNPPQAFTYGKTDVTCPAGSADVNLRIAVDMQDSGYAKLSYELVNR